MPPPDADVNPGIEYKLLRHFYYALTVYILKQAFFKIQ